MSDIYIDLENVPKGWSLTKIKSIADVLMGQSPPSDTYNEEGNGLPFFQGKAEFTELHPVVRKWCSSSNKIAIPNDILMSVRAPVGTTNIANQKCCIGRGLSSIRYIPCYKFLFFYFRLIENKLDEKGTGTTFRAISGDVIKEAELYLPPLKEQHRIVAKIEELFSSLDKGIETLKTAQEQLKVYRQAVLKWAFEGNLSETFRNKKTSANDTKILLDKIRKERELWFKSNSKKLKYDFKIKDENLARLPSEWEWVKIVETVFNTADDIVDGPFGSNLKNSDYVDGAPIPVISISNIEEGYNKKVRYITKDKFETIKRSAVYPGDIIVAKIGSTYGKTGIYPESMPVGVIPANLLRIRPSKHYNKKLLVCYLQSGLFKKKLDKIMKSTAQPAFNVSMFKDLPIPFMSIKEQDFLISEIESRLSVCDKIEDSIITALDQAEALRQSILKKAFEGKLVLQDPNDEPSTVLIEMIRKGRETQPIKQMDKKVREMKEKKNKTKRVKEKV